MLFVSKYEPCGGEIEILRYSEHLLPERLPSLRVLLCIEIQWQHQAKAAFVFIAVVNLLSLQDAYAKKLVTSEFSKTMEWNQSPRPCYDMVEEYNRSLDEYKDKVCSALHVSSSITEVDDTSSQGVKGT